MKTKQEIEKMKEDIQNKIDGISKSCGDALDFGNMEAYHRFDRQYAQAIAQYNILLEVLK